MSRRITQFMWGYQHIFRDSLEMRAREVLQRVRCKLEPEVILVGIRTPGAKREYDVCVEPEDGHWDPQLFGDCWRRTEEIYDQHPGQRVVYGDAPSMEDEPENIRKSSVKESVEEVLGKYDDEHLTRSFCSLPTRVGEYYVAPILQFDRDGFDSYPFLKEPIKGDGFVSSQSFLQSLVTKLLDEATDALVQKDPGRHFALMQTDSTTLLRDAAKDFCNAIAIASQDESLRGAFDLLNDISSLSYEGSNASGSIVFAGKDTILGGPGIRLKAAISLRKPKLVRKLVEMSRDEMVCVHAGSTGITGLVRGEAFTQYGFRALFTGHYKWQLLHHGRVLMTSLYGIPEMPTPRLSHRQFSILANRLFNEIDSESIARLWGAIGAAIKQRHGTMIVISETADKEAKRLHAQCLAIDPATLDDQMIDLVGKIDGAILFDARGVCHAIGVILDGTATDQADMSRGARYNSALRYINYVDDPTLCVVISEDGYVDLLPDLRPQVHHSDILQRIEALKQKTSKDYHETRNWLDTNRFYLTQEECDIVNREMQRIDAEPYRGTEFRIDTPEFNPDPEMNDSYYLIEKADS